jgi:hypothetical protein
MNVLFYTGCFMFQAALLLVAVIYSRLFWMLKAGLIILSLGFSLIFYRSALSVLGYPVAMTPPQQFELLGSSVHQPYPVKGDPGVVYLWVVATGQRIPRAIELPYSNDLRKQLAEAKRQMQAQANGNGRVFMGLKPSGQTQKPGAAGSSKAGAPHAHGDSRVPYDVQEAPTLEFEKPPDTVPQKPE